jgi:ADP-ribosylglycohydrolase
MIGAIAGDMIGAPSERFGIRHKDFEPVVSGFTDDTVLTVAVADALLNRGDLAATIQQYARRYPHCGYGGTFRHWIWSGDDKLFGRFGYAMEWTVDDIRPAYRFDVSCQGAVPESIICFLDAVSHEDAIKNAISLEGDADTMACIAGGIAQAYYKAIPADIVTQVRARLPEDLLDIVDRFNAAYRCVF